MTPDLDTRYTLAAEDIAAFQRNGFIKLKDVLPTALLAEYAAEITRLTIELNTESRPLLERSTYDRAFLQVMNLWRHSEKVTRFVLSQRLGRIAAELLGVAGVRLYHDQALYKEPGGGITPAHADQYYWPLVSDRTVTAWIPLQAVSQDMGPLAFYAGSQHAELGRDLPISDDSERDITEAMMAQGFALVDGPFDLGEVSFHGGWTFHKAGPNVSTQARAVMTIIYMDSTMHLKASSNAMQDNDAGQWCPGVRVGEIIDTPLNPMIYPV